MFPCFTKGKSVPPDAISSPGETYFPLFFHVFSYDFMQLSIFLLNYNLKF